MLYLTNIIELWNDRGFEIVVGLCLALLLILFIYNLLMRQKGTWSDRYYYDDKPVPKEKSNSPRKDSKGEVECRRVLQHIFRKPFHKARPDFLRNPVTGNAFNLELDCYDPELRLAVEYNGAQHYKFVPYFHNNKEAFMNQKYRDDMKRRICKENSITLIEVPYTVKIDNIKGYIEGELRQCGRI